MILRLVGLCWKRYTIIINIIIPKLCLYYLFFRLWTCIQWEITVQSLLLSTYFLSRKNIKSNRQVSWFSHFSYHHNAYFMQQAGEVVRRTPDSEKSKLFEKYIQFAFDNQNGELDMISGLHPSMLSCRVSWECSRNDWNRGQEEDC